MHQLDRIEEGITQLLAGMPGNPDFLRRSDVASGISNIITALVQEKKIEAIKMHRGLTGWGLKESKDEIERLCGIPRTMR